MKRVFKEIDGKIIVSNQLEDGDTIINNYGDYIVGDHAQENIDAVCLMLEGAIRFIKTLDKGKCKIVGFKLVIKDDSVGYVAEVEGVYKDGEKNIPE